MLRPNLALLAGVCFLVTACVSGPAPVRRATYDFEGGSGGLPPGLVVGGSAEGGAPLWQVIADDTAPSGEHVLEQSDGNGDEPRYCVLLSDAPVARDVRVSVRCQPMDGRLDRSAGLIFRAVDDQNYYVVRANLLEKDVRLYRCVDGIRVDMAAWERRLAKGRWHALEAEMRGGTITIRWNGETIIEARDSTFTEAGLAGLWTKADSVTRFDDLVIEALD